MKNKRRKMRPQPPWYFYPDTDNCYCCKNRNGCGGCKFLKKYIATKQKKYEKPTQQLLTRINKKFCKNFLELVQIQQSI